MKVLTFVGTRPELIKLSRIIYQLEKSFDHVLVHTNQNFDYELNQIFFEQLEIKKPDYYLNTASKNSAQTIAKVISESDSILEKIMPDAVLIYGDTNSCLSAISAKRRKIPVFHMEAGNRCFDQRVPEEINRKILDHISDLNMVHSEHSRRYLLNEGLPAELIIKTGSPMREVLSYFEEGIEGSDILQKLSLKEKDYFLVSIHREENVDCEESFGLLLQSLEAVAEKYDKRVIVSTHPRTRKVLEEKNIKLNERVEFLKPLGFLEYNKLQMNSLCVLSDSGTITEESSLLKFSAIMLRQAHERPEGMDVGAVVMSGISKERVLSAIELTLELSKIEAPEDIADYSPRKVSSHVVKIIQSYTDYINRVVWKKK